MDENKNLEFNTENENDEEVNSSINENDENNENVFNDNSEERDSSENYLSEERVELGPDVIEYEMKKLSKGIEDMKTLLNEKNERERIESLNKFEEPELAALQVQDINNLLGQLMEEQEKYDNFTNELNDDVDLESVNTSEMVKNDQDLDLDYKEEQDENEPDMVLIDQTNFEENVISEEDANNYSDYLIKEYTANSKKLIFDVNNCCLQIILPTIKNYIDDEEKISKDSINPAVLRAIARNKEYIANIGKDALQTRTLVSNINHINRIENTTRIKCRLKAHVKGIKDLPLAPQYYKPCSNRKSTKHEKFTIKDNEVRINASRRHYNHRSDLAWLNTLTAPSTKGKITQKLPSPPQCHDPNGKITNNNINNQRKFPWWTKDFNSRTKRAKELQLRYTI